MNRGKTGLQCWQFMKCQYGRDKSCPAARHNGGRTCWLIEGTLFGGRPQADYLEKMRKCLDCRFYLKRKNGEI